jgi:hypothetical protein
MTLIISLAAGDRVIQASDRRLSWSHEGYDDHADKAVVLNLNDLVLSISYCGLEFVGSPLRRSDDWLATTLCTLVQQSSPEIEVLEKMRAHAKEAIKVVPGPPTEKELSVVGGRFHRRWSHHFWAHVERFGSGRERAR